MSQTPAFLRGNLEGYSTLTSAWVRGLESTQEQIDKWASRLSKEGFWWLPTEDSNSIGGLVNHIGFTILRLAHVAKGWEFPPEIQILAPEQLRPSGQEPQAVIERCKAAIVQAKAWIKELKPEELEAIREWKGRGSTPALHLWHKLVEHSHEHTGQIIILRKLWNARNAD